LLGQKSGTGSESSDLNLPPTMASIVDVTQEEIAFIHELALSHHLLLRSDAARDFVPIYRRLNLNTEVMGAVFDSIYNCHTTVPCEGIQRTQPLPSAVAAAASSSSSSSQAAATAPTSSSGASLRAEFANAKMCNGIPFEPWSAHFLVTSAIALAFEQTDTTKAVLGMFSSHYVRILKIH
jgi:hypothetical protein